MEEADDAAPSATPGSLSPPLSTLPIALRSSPTEK